MTTGLIPASLDISKVRDKMFGIFYVISTVAALTFNPLILIQIADDLKFRGKNVLCIEEADEVRVQ